MEIPRTVSPFQAVRDEIRLHRRKDSQHPALLYLLANLRSPTTMAIIDVDQKPVIRSSSFSTLPPELILHIFESLSSLDEVANLTRTARVFRRVWQLHATPISHHFFPRAIDGFAIAEQLVDVQEQAEAEHQHQHQHQQDQNNHHRQEDHQKALSRTKRILSNAHQVSLVCDFFESEFIPQIVLSKHLKDKHPCHYFTSSERTRFTHSNYRLWTFTTMGKSRHSQKLRSSFLARLNNRELYCMREIGDWLTHLADREGLSRLGLIGPGEEEEDMEGNGWYLAWVELAKEWERRMAELPGSNGNMYFPDHAPLNIFAMFDMWQEWLQPSFFVGTSMWTEQQMLRQSCERCIMRTTITSLLGISPRIETLMSVNAMAMLGIVDKSAASVRKSHHGNARLWSD